MPHSIQTDDSDPSPKSTALLILTVGTGRNREDIADAIEFAVSRHRPGSVRLLCSAKTEQETLPLIRERLKPHSAQLGHDVCHDEEDVQALFVEWSRKWNGWLNGCAAEQVVVDYTTGTKAMSAAACMVAIARGAGTLSYISGPRDVSGRVAESQRIISLAPDLITAHRNLQRAVLMFHHADYAAARDLAGAYLKLDRMPDDRLRQAARVIHYVSAAYEAWDRFDYRQASSQLHQLGNRPDASVILRDANALAENRSLIQQVLRARESFGPAFCADLLANARRCMVRQCWDDAVARLYRACEMLAQFKLLKDHQQRTGRIDPGKLPAGVRAEYRERLERMQEPRKLGLAESYELLFELGDPLGVAFRARYGEKQRPGPLKELLKKRNDSLLAHGNQPIDEQSAKDLHGAIVELAEVADPEITKKWLGLAESVQFNDL